MEKEGCGLQAKDKLIVALDFDAKQKALDMIRMLEDDVDFFKVGLELFLASKGEVVDYLHNKGKKVFLDLKFMDIPNTVAGAAREAAKMGVFMFNVHTPGGKQMMVSAREAVEQAVAGGGQKPLLIGVTVLTSLDQDDLAQLGVSKNLKDLVLDRAILTKEAGLDGAVASPREATEIARICGSKFLSVCPGIRPAWAVSGDQKRIMTPLEAINCGADYLVVGRPITQAEDPAENARKILAEMKEGI
jgi:orotidine-5'-phosphate decarboxylase